MVSFFFDLLIGRPRTFSQAYSSSFLIGLGKDVDMRPLPGDEKVLPQPSVPKPVKEKKRKGAPSHTDSEGQKPKKKQTRKTKGCTDALSPDLVHRLRNEPEEGEGEEEECRLVARVRADATV